MECDRSGGVGGIIFTRIRARRSLERLKSLRISNFGKEPRKVIK